MRTTTNKPIDPSLFSPEQLGVYETLVQQSGTDLRLGDLEKVLRSLGAQAPEADVLKAMLRAQISGIPPGAFKGQAALRAQVESVPKTARVESEEVRLFRSHLDEVLIEQGPAKDTLARFYQTLKTGLTEKPFVMLEVGPPGVGKTLASSALGHAIHGDPDAILFIDCAALVNQTLLGKYVGIGPGFVGYDDDTIFSKSNIQKRFGDKRPIIIHIDEPDKMSPEVANIFWGAFNRFLETGKMELANGDVIDCNPCILSIASNAGANTATGLTGEAMRKHYEKEGAASLAKHTNSRIDAIIPFEPLSAEGRQKIAGLEIDKLFRKAAARTLAKEDKAVGLEADPAVCELFADLAGSQELGVRPIKSAVQQLLAVLVDRTVKGAEDEARYELTLDGVIDSKWRAEVKAQFKAQDGKLPSNVSPEDFPVRMVLKNPPPQTFHYQGLIPSSDYGRMTPFASGVCGGQGWLLANQGEFDSRNELLFLRPGRTEAEDTMRAVALPAELADANLGLYGTTIDEVAEITDPKQRNQRMLLVGVHAPSEGDEAVTVARVYDARTRSFTEVEPPPVPLVAAAMASIDGQVILWGGRYVENVDGEWSAAADSVGQATAIENVAYKFDVNSMGWEPLERTPTVARAGASMVKLGDRLAIIGGEEMAHTPQGAAYLIASKHVDYYDPNTGSFESGTPLPEGRAYANARVDEFGRLRVSGGKALLDNGFSEVMLSSVLSLDPQRPNAAWKARPEMPRAGDYLVAIPHPRGGVVTGPFFGEEGSAWQIEKSPPVE